MTIHSLLEYSYHYQPSPSSRELFRPTQLSISKKNTILWSGIDAGMMRDPPVSVSVRLFFPRFCPNSQWLGLVYFSKITKIG